MAKPNERLAITALYRNFCDLLDAKAFDHLDSVFTEDTVGDYSQAFGPEAVHKGLATLILLLERNLGTQSNCGPTRHNVFNFRVWQLQSAIAARVNFYAVYHGVREHQGVMYSVWGRYDDQIIHTPRGWRISYRRYSEALKEGQCVINAPGDRFETARRNRTLSVLPDSDNRPPSNRE